VESMLAMYAAELGLTGSFETFSFQGLLDGRTWQPPILVSDAAGGACPLPWLGERVGDGVVRPFTESVAVGLEAVVDAGGVGEVGR